VNVINENDANVSSVRHGRTFQNGSGAMFLNGRLVEHSEVSAFRMREIGT
jgi:hypothetical protein